MCPFYWKKGIISTERKTAFKWDKTEDKYWWEQSRKYPIRSKAKEKSTQFWMKCFGFISICAQLGCIGLTYLGKSFGNGFKAQEGSRNCWAILYFPFKNITHLAGEVQKCIVASAKANKVVILTAVIADGGGVRVLVYI